MSYQKFRFISFVIYSTINWTSCAKCNYFSVNCKYTLTYKKGRYFLNRPLTHIWRFCCSGCPWAVVWPIYHKKTNGYKSLRIEWPETANIPQQICERLNIYSIAYKPPVLKVEGSLNKVLCCRSTQIPLQMRYFRKWRKL